MSDENTDTKETVGTVRQPDRLKASDSHESQPPQESDSPTKSKIKLHRERVHDFDSAANWFAKHCREFTDREWYDLLLKLRPYADPQSLGLNIFLTTEQFQRGFRDAVKEAAGTFDCRPTQEAHEVYLRVVEFQLKALGEGAVATREHLNREGSLPAGAYLGLSCIADELAPIVANHTQ